jgi:hypothetical protein
MDGIFGMDTSEDISTSASGLFLIPISRRPSIGGFFVIIPDTEIEPKSHSTPWKDHEERHKALTGDRVGVDPHPKEYRVKVLDARPKCMKDQVLSKRRYGVETVAELAGGHLRFLTDARPWARHLR